MDDDLDSVFPAAADEDFSLPKATVNKLVQEMLPAELSCSKKGIDLIADCCVEFIHLISSEANDICEKEAKKMISGEHVVSALKSLGFEAYIEDINDTYQEHQKQVKDREKRSFKLEKTGMTEEELIRAQEMLFAASRARLQQGALSPTISTPNSALPLPGPLTPSTPLPPSSSSTTSNNKNNDNIHNNTYNNNKQSTSITNVYNHFSVESVSDNTKMDGTPTKYSGQNNHSHDPVTYHHPHHNTNNNPYTSNPYSTYHHPNTSASGNTYMNINSLQNHHSYHSTATTMPSASPNYYHQQHSIKQEIIPIIKPVSPVARKSVSIMDLVDPEDSD